ncbi:MAG TPA: hypothetical protein VKK31_07135 [Thermoanaerobaculia bacterium]|nr:hypothetical protein [Thermoanaerobaculia bacterium]
MNRDPQQDWQVRYAAKIATAEQAVLCVSGMTLRRSLAKPGN